MSKTLKTAAMTALLGLGAVAFMAGSASAYVACNDTGDCWHTDRHEHYGNDVHVQWHPDNWGWHHDWDNDRDHHWHHYKGHGYWKGGVWIQL